MPAVEPHHECVDCGTALALFRPTCPTCETHQRWQYVGPCRACTETVDYLAGECERCGTTLSIWRALEATVAVDDEVRLIWREAVPNPTEQGYRRHLGGVKGQRADYRRAADGGDFHVRRFHRYYELHYDDVSAVDSPTRHLLRHGPAAMIGTTVALTRNVTDVVARSGRVAGQTALQPYSWLRTVGDETDTN